MSAPARDSELVEPVKAIAVRAGRAILEVYDAGFEVDHKADGSPLTAADRRAHRIIVAGLTELTPDIPVLSEEAANIDHAERRRWRRFWLVDPLDGTKEFVKRNGEFTVNIALIEDGAPRVGVVHTPVRGLTHWGVCGMGAYRQQGEQGIQSVTVRDRPGAMPVIAASRSHASANLRAFLREVKARFGDYRTVTMGSSLKLCLVAEGSADVYPRLGPTSEWDTAAAHAVVSAAGGEVVDCEGRELRYNKPDILNPWFIVCPRNGYDWTALTRRLPGAPAGSS